MSADLIALAEKCGLTRFPFVGEGNGWICQDANLEAFAAVLSQKEAAPSEAEERATFEAWRGTKNKMVDRDAAIARLGFGDDAPYVNKQTKMLWYGWKARAAIAPPQAPEGGGL
jgi:hypothetical protein